MNKKNLIYFIFFLLLALSAAAKEDFDVTAQAKIDLCPCSNQAYPIYIYNKGDVASTYSVSFAGSAAKWVKANPSKFSINPGAISYFFVYANSDCNIKEGYDLKTYITASSGLSKAVKQNLSFIECYKFDIELGNLIELEEEQKNAVFSKHIGTYNICENEEKILPVLIANKESYGNNYLLSLKGAGWAKVADEVSLDGSKKGLVLINLNPGNASEGTYKLRFNAVTRLGNVKQGKEIDINVDKCYGLKIDLEKDEDSVCGEDSIYNVEIENGGTLKEEVNLSSNFDWAKINNTLLLEGNKEAISQLILTPNISGIFDVEIKGFVVNHSDIKASEKIKLNWASKEECYNAEISKKRMTNHYSEEYYSIDITNKGLKKASYNASLEGPSWASITPGFIELNPGQKANLNLYVNPDKDVKAGSYKLILKLNFNDAVYSREFDIKLAKENKIVKNIKNFASYFRFYIYLIIFIIILILIFIQPIKKQIGKIKNSYDKYKVKKEKQEEIEKQREEKRKAKEEAKRKKELEKEKQKRLKEERLEKEKEEKKAEARKKAEKVPRIKKSKFKKYFALFILLFVLIIIASIFLSFYFKLIDNALFKEISSSIFLFITGSVKGIWAYSYYIFVAFIFLALIILFFHNLEKEEKKEPSIKKKTRFKFFKSAYFRIFLTILILSIISYIVFYYFYSTVKEFFILYSYYIIIGIIIVIIMILFIKFYKPVVDFLTKEEK